MALKFLFDECMSVLLVSHANDRSFEAYHVAHRGLAGCLDHELLSVIHGENLILVTNNGPDFRRLVARQADLHPGVIVFCTQVRPSAQIRLFDAVVDHLAKREDLINRVIEMDLDAATKGLVDGQTRLSEAEWRRIEAEMVPEIREYDLGADLLDRRFFLADQLLISFSTS